MTLAVLFAASLAISQLAFMGLLNLLYYRKRLTGRLVAVYSVCMIAVIVVLLPHYPPGAPGRAFLVQIAIATPAVLWILSHYLFEDSKKIPLPMWFLLFAYQGTSALATVFADNDSLLDQLSTLFNELSMFIILMHVLVIVIKDKMIDLVELRRQMRVPFAVGHGLILALIVVLITVDSILLAPDLVNYALFLINTLIFVFSLAINLSSFKMDNQSVTSFAAISEFEDFVGNSQTPAKNIDARVLARINKQMLESKVFRNPQLTISELATSVYVSEHKLRRIINQGMGYKNFNQFLNQKRIDDAKNLLANSPHLPVSTVALEVGFASLSSFNKAFKEITGSTPSRFKNETGHADVESDMPHANSAAVKN